MLNYNEEMANMALSQIDQARKNIRKKGQSPKYVVMNDTTYKNLAFAVYTLSNGATGAYPDRIFDIPVVIVPDYCGIYVACDVETEAKKEM